ncbi:MAG: hypothetical protein ABIH25_01500 [Candidatus Woesearchaeota archaeon]
MKKKVTLSIYKKIYNEFQTYCGERGLILSRQVEFFMKKELEVKDHKK